MLSVRQQCDLLSLPRSSLYYETKVIELDEIHLLNEIRDVWERYPFYGYRRINKELISQGWSVNKKRVQRVMRQAGIQAIFPGPNTSRRNKLHASHPYLLADMKVTQANQVWMVDITYLKLSTGFVYLVALIDVYSRFIVSWKISNTLDTLFCIEALKVGLMTAKPTILNSDQGCQFTSHEWIKFLKEKDIQISMTGKGRCLDNVYIERFWRSFKREEFYLNEYGSIKDLKKATELYIGFYNYSRWHQSLDYKTPAQYYFSEQKNPVGRCTSPSDQSASFGECGESMDNAIALSTLSPHSPLLAHQRTGSVTV